MIAYAQRQKVPLSDARAFLIVFLLAGKTSMLISVYSEFEKSHLVAHPSVCAAACAGGHLPTINWLSEHGGTFNELSTAAAAEHNHLELLKWLRNDLGCAWTESTTVSAALRGHLEVLQWAHSHGCPFSSNICASTARQGHFEALKYLVANGALINEWTCSAAARGGYLHILQWLRERQCPVCKQNLLAIATCSSFLTYKFSLF